MQFLYSLAVTTCVFILAACTTQTIQATQAPKLNIHDPQAVRSAITVQRDDFKKITNYTGPNASAENLKQLFIRAWRSDASGTIEYQIYVMDRYFRDWRFYDSAYDSNGNRLNTTLIARKVDSCARYGCTYKEHLGLNVTREYLEKARDTGIHFKLSGKAGEETFTIPAGYISAFLSVAE